MDDMDELVEWLRAQLDEDERKAQASSPGPWQAWYAMSRGQIPVKVAEQPAGSPPLILCSWRSDAEHIARHDPARVLREVEAKRRIVERYEFVTSHGPAVDQTRALDMTTGAAAALADVLKLLALPYADRSGYRSEWAPSTA